MNKGLNYILASVVTAVILASLGAAIGISGTRRDAMVCSGVSVTVRDSTENRFVSSSDVKGYVSEKFGKLEGSAIRDISLKEIESTVDSKSAVLKSEAYVTKDGKINISVTQRKPVMRLQKNGYGVYGDKEGYLFPLKNNYSSHVIVIDGYIPLEIGKDYKGRGNTPAERRWIEDICSLVGQMQDSRIWMDNIVQIHVQKNGDLVMIPREGREKILFGKPSSADEKFELLSYYYTSILPAKGKDYYGKVDLRYDGQIVCSR